MDIEPSNSSDESMNLRKEVEKLSAENLLLRQRTELEHLWREDRDKQSQAFNQHKSDVTSDINKRLVGLSVVGLIVVGLAWWSISLPIRKSVQDRLNQEFASDNIKKLISEAAFQAAQSQTKTMMETTLKPAVAEAMKQIKQQQDAVVQFTQQFRQESGRSIGQIRGEMSEERLQEKQSLTALRDESTKQLNDLRTLVEFQEQLKEIELLKNNAIAGDYDAYDKLKSYKTQDKTLGAAAITAVIEVKEPYLVGTRTKGISIWLTNPDGTKGLTDEKIPTSSLITLFLAGSQQWEARTKAAEILASKRETGVAEALLNTLLRDQNLWVRHAALVSYQGLTGFQPNDVFDFDRASEWWEKNKVDYLKTITK
jgi:hypothetical protein